MTSSTEPKPFLPLGSVLITGGCGFLGSHIVSHLLDHYDPRSTSVSILDLRTSSNTFPGATYHAADLTSADSVREVLAKSKPDVVIHTASPVFGSGGGKKSMDLMYKVNVEGTRVLLEESRRIGSVKAFVYTSSASVVSDSINDLRNADERWGLVTGKAQAEYYSDTKAQAETLVLKANTRHPTPFLTTAIRPASMFGERDVQLIPGLLGAYKDGRTKWQLGSNDNLFDFTYVGNVAHAHSLAAAGLLATWAAVKTGKKLIDEEDEEGKGVDGEAFIITNAAPVAFWDFARAVWNMYHARISKVEGYARSISRVRPLPPVHPANVFSLSIPVALVLAAVATWACWLLRLPEPSLNPAKVRYSGMTRYFKGNKARERLGYVPVWGMDESVSKTVDWFVGREVEGRAKKGN